MAVVEQQEMEWTLWEKKERNCMFLYSISHKSTFMEDKSNISALQKYKKYLKSPDYTLTLSSLFGLYSK